MADGPKVYRSDTATAIFAKQFVGAGGITWSLVEQKGGFVLSVHNIASTHFEGWQMDREQLANIWEMISEALHHDD